MDGEAELAFLQALKGDENEGNDGTGNGYYDPSAAPQGMHIDEDEEDEEDEEDYDPSSLLPDTTVSLSDNESRIQTPSSRPISAAPEQPSQDVGTTGSQVPPSITKQPRTMGGFVVDDEDEDDDGDDDEVAATVMRPKGTGPGASSGLLDVAQGTSHTPHRSLAHTSNNVSSTADVPSSMQYAAEASGVGATDGTSETVPNLAAVLPETGASSRPGSTVAPPQNLPAPPKIAATVMPPATTEPATKARLPHDRIGILEDRIADDPRGDIEAWLSLITEHQRRGKMDEARAVYERFFKVFPSSAEQWCAYATMELENDELPRAESIYSRSLLQNPNVQLWSMYLDYVRRRQNLTDDADGNKRRTVTQAYEFVLNNVGIDKDSGQIWNEYIQFVRSGPGKPGGTGWQDQQKADSIRKAYQRAICVPTQVFRKVLQEKSPAYMTARSSYVALQRITDGLKRTTLPALPPAFGFEGDMEYTQQVDLWKRWIQWEKEDPLVLKSEDFGQYRERIVYVYKQALMALRFWPEMWYDAAEFCFENGLETEGNDFIAQGISANPESCLLAFKRADRVEATTSNDDGEDGQRKRGAAVREPYDGVLNALYELIQKTKIREAQTVERVKEQFANNAQQSPEILIQAEEEEDDQKEAIEDPQEKLQKQQIEAIQKGADVQIKLLSKTISFVWIALMRAMRRVLGRGLSGERVGGFRQVFADARKRGRLTSDVYVANALIEYHCYKDPAATKIFERGTKLFPEDENFVLEYLKHLFAINDITNARAVFETTVNRLAQKPETLQKAKPIYAFFHEYESHYGELSQVSKLEKRMSELFPDDLQLSRFSHRYVAGGFDPTSFRPIISPTTQAKPKFAPAILPSIEKPASVENSPRPAAVQPALAMGLSPKRHLPLDESDQEQQPRKFARGESPLKGAAGRRLAKQRNDLLGASGQHATPVPAPQPLPREVTFLLGIIPAADTYHATIFSPQKMVELLRNTDLSRAVTQQRPPPSQYGQNTAGYPYNR